MSDGENALCFRAELGSAGTPLIPDPAVPGRDISGERWLSSLLALQLLHLEPQLPEHGDQQQPRDQADKQQHGKQGDQPDRGHNSDGRSSQLLDPLRPATARQLLHGEVGVRFSLPLMVAAGAEARRPTGHPVLRSTSAHALAPHPERGGFERMAHDGDYLRFADAELSLNGLKGGAVFPGHFDDTAHVVG